MKYLFSFVIILPMVFVFSCTPKAETITANEEDAIQSMMLLLATPDPETTSLLSLKHEVRVGLVDSLLFEYRSRTKYSFFRDNGVGENQITNSYDFHVLAL